MECAMNITPIDISNFSHQIVEEPLKSTKELIKEYCTAVDHRLVYLFGFIFILWLFESKFKSWTESLKFDNELTMSIIGGKNLGSAYKMIGLGLLFMAIYLLVIRGW
jgi:hypothetical protein